MRPRRVPRNHRCSGKRAKTPSMGFNEAEARASESPCSCARRRPRASPRFNEAEARASESRGQSAAVGVAIQAASMRPRRVPRNHSAGACLLTFAAACFNEAEARASESRIYRLAKTEGGKKCFNEAEARASESRGKIEGVLRSVNLLQ